MSHREGDEHCRFPFREGGEMCPRMRVIRCITMAISEHGEKNRRCFPAAIVHLYPGGREEINPIPERA